MAQRKAGTQGAGIGQQLASLDAGVQVLTMFTRLDSVNVTAVSRELGCSRSTAYRVLNTLRNRGVVVLGPTGRGYYPGPVLHELARPYGWDHDDQMRIDALLEDAVRRCNETVHVATLVGTMTLLVDGKEPERTVRAELRLGYLRPAYSVSAGMLLLSELGDDTIRTLFPVPPLAKVTPWTVGSVAELLAEVERVRGAGFAVTDRAAEPELSGVAVRLPGRSWRDRLALCAQVPRQRAGYEELFRIRTGLEEAAQRFA